jgi:mycofactocin system creatininase family protein
MPVLGDLAWPEVPEDAVLAVPVGATEQHGAHLPLSTDTEIAVALAQRLATARPGVVVAPAVAYGASGEHQAFPGTLSIGNEAIELLLVELGRSASETFARIVFVSAHGGNARPVWRAVRRLRDEGRDARAWSPRWDGDAHAGRTETAVMLALRPEAVRLELAAAGNAAPLAELMPALVAGGVRSVSRNGVLGDPEGATAEAGDALLEEATQDLLLAAGG